jgi:hypothetical protein
VDQTIKALESSRALVRNLSSLSYHHYPHHLPHTNNARRLVNAPRTIIWDPQSPGAAMKAHKAVQAKYERDPVNKIREQALTNLGQLVNLAEEQEGILLGKIDKVW